MHNTRRAHAHYERMQCHRRRRRYGILWLLIILLFFFVLILLLFFFHTLGLHTAGSLLF